MHNESFKYKFLSILLVLSLSSCKKNEREYTYDNIDFKQEMRNFVKHISQYSKSLNSDFQIVTQNGVQLITSNGQISGQVEQTYVNALDGQAQEGLFFGNEQDNTPTDPQITAELKQFLKKAQQQGKSILITDYCTSPNYITRERDSIDANAYVGYIATHRELDIISPIPIHHENSDNIGALNEAQNFLYILNLNNFPDKISFISAVTATNYDIVITDLFFNDNTAFSANDISSLKHKENGGTRLVLAYVSIGEAEDYRYYWQNQWYNDPPIWLDEENSDWHGNYKVRYWETEWQNIIYGNNQSYLKKVLDAGFDGAYLDIIDAFEFFEEKTG